MIYLKKYVKYRKEDNFLLICDCSTIQNYELPLSSYELFEKLKTGYNPNHPLGIELENDILDDLKNLQLVDNIPNSNNNFHESQWINLGYEENEFF